MGGKICRRILEEHAQLIDREDSVPVINKLLTVALKLKWHLSQTISRMCGIKLNTRLSVCPLSLSTVG
jgi:hypothetical protein